MLAGRGQAERRSGRLPSAGACSAGPPQPWMPLRAGRVQIGSLVWRPRDWLGKEWHWWRWEPKGMVGLDKNKTNKT